MQLKTLSNMHPVPSTNICIVLIVAATSHLLSLLCK